MANAVKRYETTPEVILIIVLRIAAILAGIFQVVSGDLVMGVFIFLATGALMAPALFTRNKIRTMPLTIEIIFFMMILLQFVIGETLNLYRVVPYYDKLVHFSLPLMVGLISFIIAYTLHQTGNLRMSTGPLMVIIVLMTLGIGAIWEIIEYLTDVFLNPMFDSLGALQGNFTEPAIVDTMNDLILDVVGGIFGAILGWRYISYSESRKSKRLSNIVEELSSNFKK